MAPQVWWALPSIRLPLKLVSEANVREHWAKKAGRAKIQKFATRVAVQWVMSERQQKPPMPCRVVLTRLGKRKLDSDNLQRAFKAVRDGVAKAVGIDDGSDELQWEYKQIQDKSYAVVVEVWVKA